MKTVTFSFTVKFPAKKVIDCFTNPGFAKLHKASKLFVKAGIIKADKKMIIRNLAETDKAAPSCIAIINFADADAGKATVVSATIVNYPDSKAAGIKDLGKQIESEIKTFLTPKPVVVAAKPAAKAAAKKPAAKKPAAKKTVAKPAAKKPAPKAVAKKPAAKPAAKKPAPKAAVKPAAKPAPKPIAKPAPVVTPVPTDIKPTIIK